MLASVAFAVLGLTNPVLVIAIVLAADLGISYYLTGPVGERFGAAMVRIFEAPGGGWSPPGRDAPPPGSISGGPDLAGMQQVENGKYIQTANPFFTY